jgi:hypothetical protein
MWFSASGDSRKTRNLAGNPAATVTTDNPHQPVVIEGRVERVADEDLIGAFAHAVNDKYGTDYAVSFFAGNACFRLRPDTVFGIDDADFVGSPTRWTFD